MLPGTATNDDVAKDDQQDNRLKKDEAMNGVVGEILNHVVLYAAIERASLPARDAGESLLAGRGDASMPE